MLPPELAGVRRGALPGPVCAEIIDAAERCGDWLRSGGVGYRQHGLANPSRTSAETWVERHAPLLWVRDQWLAAATRALDVHHGRGGPRRYFYESRVVRYHAGEYLRAHTDNPRPLDYRDNPEHGARAGFFHHGRRKVLTLVLYLNDDYTGGELLFHGSGQQIKPGTGDLLLFPPGELHEARPVLSGTKYILTNALFYAD